MESVLRTWNPWLGSAAAVTAAVIIAMAATEIALRVAYRATQRAKATTVETLLRYAKRPARLTTIFVCVYLSLFPLPLPASLLGGISHAVALCLIGGFAWLLIGLMGGIAAVLAEFYRIDAADNLRARRLLTQVQVLRGIASACVAAVAIGVMLLTFPAIQQLGVSLFASAGIASIVVGLAARPTLSNLLAGIQIALTEPIRVEDVVIVEGEWGWIEEITTTYVVVRIWDLRRLVVPLSYFIEKPFQNWTRHSGAILGTVYLYVDFTIPTDEVREELLRILEATPMWDKQAWGLQVTDATEHTVQLRALMSAPDSGTAWDLRCHVREKLLDFVREKYPDSLPRVRAEVERASLSAAPWPTSQATDSR